MSQAVPTVTTPAPPSIGRAAGVFLLVGPAMGAVLFALFFGVIGIFDMGLGAPLVAVFYAVWFVPFLYLALGVPFLLTGIAYAIAARRYARPSLLLALMAGACVFTTCLGLLYLSGWQATVRGVSMPGADALTIPKFLKNLATLTGAMVIGVVPSWWLVRDPGARPRWI